MLSYACLGTNDLPTSVSFYDATLEPLGLRRCTAPGEELTTGWAGWKVPGSQDPQDFVLWVCTPFDGQAASGGNGAMLAFRAGSQAAVQAFHEAALRNGGTSEGEPGLRPQYAPDFYVAYVRDPGGNKIAAVCRGPAGAR